MAFALSSPCKLLLRRGFRFQRCSLSYSGLGHLHRRAICSANAASDAASTQTLSDAPAVSLQKHLEAGLSVVVLKRGKAALFRNARNPLVYGGAVERYIPCNEGTYSETEEAAEPVVVVDGGYHAVGYGFYNPHSMFRVRLLSHIVPNEKNMHEQGGFKWDVEADIRARIEDALRLRKMLGLPNEGTNAFRIVNGDGDRLSGLTVDRYEDVLVVSSSALWCERFRTEIELALRSAVESCKDIIWRRSLDRLRQDGFSQQIEDGHQAHSEAEEGILEKNVERNGNMLNSAHEQTRLEGEEEELTAKDKEELHYKSDCMQVLENGAIFNLSQRALHSGQKTGHYTDQRENRLYLSSLLRARSASSNNNMAMLDLFCYTGGFGLSCALSAPKLQVTGVDSSAQALSLASLNTSANGMSSQMQFIRADVSKFLRDSAAAKNSTLYDVIVLDPPKFAPNSKTLPRALRKYRALNAAAMKLVRQGGLLLTCSCSAAVTRNRGVFVDMLREAAYDSRKEIKLLRTMGAAADHPVASELPETEYLTACLFVVQDMT